MAGLPGTHSRRRVYLLRHGAVDYFRPDGGVVASMDDVPLSAQGREDARAAADALADVAFDRAYCTPFPRTRETAEAILRNGAPELMPIHDLREVQSGRPVCESMEEYEQAVVHTFEGAHVDGARMVGGELFAEAQARVLPAFEALVLEPGWTTMLIAAHGGVNRIILGWVCGIGLQAMSLFEQDPGCINVIDLDMADGTIERRMIRAVNVTPANPAKHGVYLTNMEEVFQPIRRMLTNGGSS